MLLKDFKETKRLEKILKTKKGRTASFCECCFDINPDTDDGYTECCNERIICGSEALQNTKQSDILVFLDTKFSASSNGSGTNKTFVLLKKNKSFSISMNLSKEDIMKEVKSHIKGLRKEF